MILKCGKYRKKNMKQKEQKIKKTVVLKGKIKSILLHAPMGGNKIQFGEKFSVSATISDIKYMV